MASVIAGVSSGLVVLASEMAWAGPASPASGGSTTTLAAVAGVQAVVALALAFVMRKRYAKSGKFMPAGLVAGLSVVALLGYGFRLNGALRRGAGAGHEL
jgi:LPXTG-motif cell wall-anchored protein